MDNYEKQANDFLTKTNTTFEARFLGFGKHFDDDKENRDIYEITLKRGGRVFTFNFGQSINSSQQWHANTNYAKKISEGLRLMGESKRDMNKALMCIGVPTYSLNDNDFIKNKYFSAPTAYSVLACLTKYDIGTLENFCDEFGYDADSKKVDSIYDAVLNEWHNVAMLWNDEEIEALQEIN